MRITLLEDIIVDSVQQSAYATRICRNLHGKDAISGKSRLD